MQVRPASLLTVCLLLSSAARAESPPTAAPPEPAGMESLFNGRDLTGWDGDPRLWSVREGVIHGETTKENPSDGNTFLIWQGGEVGDFELRLAFRCNATNNSGIQYRSWHVTDETAKNKWVVRGYQHELRNENTQPDVPGFIYDEGGTRGRICLAGERAVWRAEDGKKLEETLVQAEELAKLVRIDGWNDVVIRAEGNRFRHWLNGRLILDFTDDDPQLARAKGLIALQLHAGKPMWVECRDLRLKKLP
jgi:Domain of Unknown Function (DUF1080)